MSEKINSVEKIHDYFKLCDKIKESDTKIRFAGIINDEGRLVAGGSCQICNRRYTVDLEPYFFGNSSYLHLDIKT